jgi:hypothetical protein
VLAWSAQNQYTVARTREAQQNHRRPRPRKVGAGVPECWSLGPGPNCIRRGGLKVLVRRIVLVLRRERELTVSPPAWRGAALQDGSSMG